MNTDAQSIAAIVADVASGRSTAVDQVRRSIEAHGRTAPRCAFIEVDPAAALQSAAQSDRRPGGRPLPLRGVVVAVKDNIDVAGFATTAGTPALGFHRPQADAPVVKALRAAGATVLGKSNMHELAYGATSDNAAFGRVRHPLVPERIAGGSSGGSACAVASAVVPAALGTETGCSIRVPAALCGLVGFRPTVGRYALDGVVPVSWTRDTIGLLTRDVEGVRVLDAVIQQGLGAPTVRGPLVGRELRLGAPRRPFWQNMNEALSAAFADRLARLRDEGITIVEAELPDGVQKAASECGLPLALYETPRAVDRYLKAHGLSLRFPEIADRIASPDVAGILQPIAANSIPDEAYRRALAQRAHLDRLMADYLSTHLLDGLIVPTVPITAPTLYPNDQIEVDGELTAAFPFLVRNTDVSSILGWPAISLPAGRDASGLPFGVDLQFPRDADSALLDAAEACERIWSPASCTR